VTIRGLISAIYCLILLLGTWWIVQRNQLTTVDFVANRDLPRNRWLQPGDVVRANWDDAVKGALRIADHSASDFTGRYVRGSIPKGAALRWEATDAVPHVASLAGQISLLAVLPRSGFDNVNAESCVQVNVGDDMPFVVRAILCPATPQADCAAIIDAPVARVAAIGASSGALAVVAEVAEAKCQ
jgi:hypothetical protein